jgi:predicted nucleic acid-binding protein
LRVVFDTNIYVSAFAIPGGDAEEAFLHAARGSFELLAAIPILTETSGGPPNKV